MKNITNRQKEILDFITNYIKDNSFPPTYREIGYAFGITSTFGVKRHIDALNKKGYLNTESNSNRTISLTKAAVPITSEPQDEYLQIPLLGRVAAGIPVLSEENIESYITVPISLIRGKGGIFALRVRGESMIKAGIMDGDFVFIEQTRNIKAGDIIVAMLAGEATLKRYGKIDGKTSLIAENDNYQPISVEDRHDFSIIGKLKAVFRNYNN